MRGKLLITGGAGYVGSALVPHLAEHRWDIDVVDALVLGQDASWIEKYGNLYTLDFRFLDETILEKYDVIIHLAGLSNDPMAHFSPRLNFEINTAGTTLLAYKAKRAGVKKFIFASSASLYQGVTDSAFAKPGNISPMPNEPYALSKMQAETGLLAISSDTFKTTILRKGTIGGYAPKMRYDLVMNTMYMCARRDGVVKVFVNGFGDSVMRPHLSIRDAVQWYASAANNSLGSNIYNVLSANVNVLEIAEAVCEKTGAELVREEVTDTTLLRNYVMGHHDSRVPDIGYSTGIRTDVDGLLKNAPEDFDNPAYYNIRMWEKWLERE